MMILSILLCVIRLVGVTGTELRARAFFDANNVKVGDPLVLTVDFLGEADFSSLHPPALSRNVRATDWKVDDASAKTDTFRDARRLTYRVRPMRAGVLWFPSLTFAFAGAEGEEKLVSANAIPVHARGGAQVVVAEMGEEVDKMPDPGALVTQWDGDATSPDTLFAWRKACAAPTSAAFDAFDTPAARLNAATCAIREGNWARALSIYARLEWQTGQTPEIERGIVAALARKYDNPAVELPVWRQVARPILRYGWKGRVGIVLGALLLLSLLFAILSRGIRAVACLALLAGLLPAPGQAQDIFRQMEEQMRQMQERMQRMTGGSGFGFSFGGDEEREPVSVDAHLSTDVAKPQVGEPFNFILALEAPKSQTLDQLRVTPLENFGMTITDNLTQLEDVASRNPSNVIHRLVVPVRYDVPYSGKVGFRVDGMAVGRVERRRGNRVLGSYSFSTSFNSQTQPFEITIRPLPTAGQPDDYAGIVSEGLTLLEKPDILRLGTNDIITITYVLRAKGHVPPNFLPKDVAFEAGRETDDRRGTVEVRYTRYVVADGIPATPKLGVSYYDPRKKAYSRITTGGTRLVYVLDAEARK